MRQEGDLLVKLVMFSVIEGRLRVFLPNDCLPIGVLVEKKSLNGLARDILERSIGSSAKDAYLEQLYTFSYPKKKETEIVVTYFVLVPEFCIPEKEGKKWVDSQVRNDRIIKYAVQRLRWKIEYTNVVYSLLPKEFTLSELRSTYEAILGRKLDKRNFRKKILSLNILKPTGKKKKLGKARPAKTFCFRKRKLEFVEVL